MFQMMSSAILEDLQDGREEVTLTNSQTVQQSEALKRKSRVNWTESELLVLQAARRDDMQNYATGGAKKNQKSGAERWKAITEACMSAGVTRTSTQCKDKWESTRAEWKRVYDYETDIHSECESYWKLTSKQRKALRLPSSFFASMYQSMLPWCVQSATVDPEEIMMETANATAPGEFLGTSTLGTEVLQIFQKGVTSKSTSTTSDQDEEPEMYGDKAIVQNDTSTPRGLRSRDDHSNELPIGKRRKTRQAKSLQGLLQLLEKNNELMANFMNSSEERKNARHQEIMQFKREKFLKQSELDKSKFELSKQIGLRYINALASIGENIKRLEESITQGSKDLE